MKRLLVTGATGGLGGAIVRLLDGLGHRTVITGRDQQRLRELESELSHAQILVWDLSEARAAGDVVEQAVTKLGGLDAVINNGATIDPIAPLAKAKAQSWERAVAVNLTAPALLMAAALPHLEKSGGRLVNISTGAAVKPMPGWSAYCASKAGLLQLTAVAALEHPEVPCFSLRPGVIDTGMQAAIRQSDGMRAADLKRFTDLHADGGLEPPEVPARAAIWLALHGPAARSGQLVEYTDAEVKAGVEQLFGANKG